MRWRLALLAVIIVGLPFASTAQAETRVALVIGNSGYRAVPALPNPRRDAGRIAASLRSAGFQSVTVVDDGSRADLIAALNRFSDAAERADWAIVYYAGHGIEIGGANYLIPVDARLKSDRDITDEAIPLDRVLQAIESAHKLRVVILDACRDNPFASSMRRTIATRSVGRGLAQVEPEGGTLVAFAAKHGQTALDGDGENSPFAEALARRLVTPGVEINKLFRLVRDDVMASTGRRQEPFVYGSLPGEDFYFVSNSLATQPAVASTNLPAKLPSTAATPTPPVAQKPAQVAALPPAQDLLPPARQSTPDSTNAPVNAPLVSFSRSNSGWNATISLPEPAIAISWRLGDKGEYQDTGFLDVIDQRVGRRMPNPSIPLDIDTPAATLNLRYVDAAGVTVGPFPIPFDPSAALFKDQRKIIEMVAGSWLSFRDFNGVLLYYTALVSYRCAIKELRIGLDKAEPDRVIPLPPCDEANPFAIPGNFTPYLKAPPGTRSASAQIVYRDGSLSAVKMFRH
ncbi:caspase family protein [Methylobacterium sp. C25]|uniref:caspase family protein n=1 Tax=Methylobacterium sp. C25 TaxID=2721622 RepID=UPI001F32DB91|nr:caspase family protein [Methylobacterium sp. C25]